MKRKETEWTTEKQKLNDKIKEAEEKQKSEHLDLKTRLECGNRFSTFTILI